MRSPQSAWSWWKCVSSLDTLTGYALTGTETRLTRSSPDQLARPRGAPDVPAPPSASGGGCGSGPAGQTDNTDIAVLPFQERRRCQLIWFWFGIVAQGEKNP